MNEDPYSGLVSLIQEAGQPKGPVGPAHLRLGKVLSVDPLKVDVAGTTQEAERIYISHRLVQEHQELLRLACTDVTADLSIFAACGMGAHSHMDIYSGTWDTPHCVATQAEPVLKPEDEVLLLTEDDQIFFLIDKVVKAG